MTIKFDGSVVNLKTKSQQIEKKREQADVDKSGKSAEESKSSQDTQKSAAIIDIRNENKLAASSSIKSFEEAESIVDMLRQKFAENSAESLNAHKKADANAVMSFYPFE